MFSDAINVLRYGSEVSHVEAWKKGGIAVSFITALLSLVLGMLHSRGLIQSPVSADSIADAAPAVVTIVAFIIGLFTAATSSRAGILPALPNPAGPAAETGEPGNDPQRERGA